jgi:hypothetical protein
MASPTRFDPPPVEIPDALRWVLRRAFGPAGLPALSVGDGGRALELARRSSLAALIGSRHSLGALAAEVGSRAAARFILEHEAAVQAAPRLMEALGPVGEAASAVGSPVVLLKFAALTLAGHTPYGTRTAGDVDVLVAPEAIEAVAEGLRARGFTPSGYRDGVHQLAPLRDGHGRVVELHRHVPGLRVPEGGGPATAEALLGAGVVDEGGSPAGAREGVGVPVREVLLAHAIVHGVAQHGFKSGYPLFRMVADVVALGGRASEGEGVHRWIAGAVSAEEATGALALAERLAAGDVALFEPGGPLTPDVVLLRHFTAVLLDEDYVHSLRLRWLVSSRGRRGPAAWVRGAWEAVAVTDAQIDVLYGPPRGRLGYLGWRVLRPFDLVRRGARYGLSALRLRLRG